MGPDAPGVSRRIPGGARTRNDTRRRDVVRLRGLTQRASAHYMARDRPGRKLAPAPGDQYTQPDVDPVANRPIFRAAMGGFPARPDARPTGSPYEMPRARKVAEAEQER